MWFVVVCLWTSCTSLSIDNLLFTKWILKYKFFLLQVSLKNTQQVIPRWRGWWCFCYVIALLVSKQSKKIGCFVRIQNQKKLWTTTRICLSRLVSSIFVFMIFRKVSQLLQSAMLKEKNSYPLFLFYYTLLHHHLTYWEELSLNLLLPVSIVFDYHGVNSF